MGKSAIVPVYVPRKLMAALTYRDDKILARNLLFEAILLFDPGGAILPPPTV
jgi:hypothetical protein